MRKGYKPNIHIYDELPSANITDMDMALNGCKQHKAGAGVLVLEKDNGEMVNLSTDEVSVKPALSFKHDPVMVDEVITHLAIKPDGIYIDGTLGGGGHAKRVIKALITGLLVGIDRDRQAIEAASARLAPYADRFITLRGNFKDMPHLLLTENIKAVDGVLLDLGVSSYQLDTAGRGFSYRLDGRLDMRMDDRDKLTAYEIVNHYSEKHIADIIFAYGEERFAKRIARAVCANRPIETTMQLAALIEETIPFTPQKFRSAKPTLRADKSLSGSLRAGHGHPAKRTFQALRIEVNGELQQLDESIRSITNLLKPGGRLCVITFHSLEDRIVKQCFKSLADPCTCPRQLPYCVCGQQPQVKIITRKPVLPGEVEIQENRRAHSAKLRVVEKL